MIQIGITGATGFLGSYLTGYLHSRGLYSIRALTRSLKSGRAYELERVKWVQGDLASRVDCEEFVDRLDVIIHLAHTNTALTSGRDMPADAASNLVPMLTLLEAMRASGKTIQIIYASSGGAVYGTSQEHRAFS